MVHPGPAIPDLLFLHSEHRALKVFGGREEFTDKCLQVRRCDKHLWDLVDSLSPEVLQCVRQAGFYGVLGSGKIQIDHSLVTALVERWRPETHTFHLPIGETTITLQDVGVLWGLPVDGLPVTGFDQSRTKDQWELLCRDLLGFNPPTSAIEFGTIKLSALSDQLRIPPQDTSPLLTQQRARIVIMLLLGGLLLSDTTGSRMPLMYLPMLADFEAIRHYSWGGAVLAHLYRNMCDTALCKKNDISGALVLLQLWAWERIITVSPQLRYPVEVYQYGYGDRWNGSYVLSKSPRHVLDVYRDQLSSLKPHQFIWQPYTEDVLASLPDYCTSGRDIWMSRVFLICWNEVEPHYPDRVLRQFGLSQPIPEVGIASKNDYTCIHKHSSRKGCRNTNWETTLHVYVQQWHQRRATIIPRGLQADPSDPSPEYMPWYRSRTVTFIRNPDRYGSHTQGFQGNSERADIFEHGLADLHRRSQLGMEQVGCPIDGLTFTQIDESANPYYEYARDPSLLRLHHTQVNVDIPAPNVQYNDDQSEPRPRGRRQGGRRPRAPLATSQSTPSTPQHGHAHDHASQHEPYGFHTPTVGHDHASSSIPSSSGLPRFGHVGFDASIHDHHDASSNDDDASTNEDDEQLVGGEPTPRLRRSRRERQPTHCGTGGKLGHCH